MVCPPFIRFNFATFFEDYNFTVAFKFQMFVCLYKVSNVLCNSDMLSEKLLIGVHKQTMNE